MTYPSKVVLVEYYGGTAAAGDTVRLRRQPKNLFGRTSIRVDNMAGAQIGYLPDADAAIFNRRLDSKEIKIKARATGPLGEFEMPIEFRIIGPEGKDWELAQAEWASEKKNWATVQLEKDRKKAADRESAGLQQLAKLADELDERNSQYRSHRDPADPDRKSWIEC